MAVAFDTKSTAVNFSGGQTSPVNNNTMTVGGTATCLIAVATFTVNSPGTLSSVLAMSWNSISMTLIGSKVQSDGLGAVYVYGLASPATGAHTLTCNFTPTLDSTNSGSLNLDCYSFTGTALTTSVALPTGSVLTDASTPAGTVYPASAFSIATTNGDAVSAVMVEQQGFNNFGAASGIIIANGSLLNGAFGQLYNLATTTTTLAQFNGVNSSIPAAGVAFKIAQLPPVTYTHWTQWPDFAPRAKQVPQQQHLAYGNFVAPLTGSAVGAASYLDSGARFNRRVFYRSITQPLVTTTPTQVWFPTNSQWPDILPAAKRPTDPQSLIFLNVPPTAVTVADWQPYVVRARPYIQGDQLAFVPVVQTATVPTMDSWLQWPDFAPRAKAAAYFQPWTIGTPPAQVFFPYGPWDDFARKPKPLVDINPWTFVPPPFQVWYPPERTPDFAPGPRRTAQFQDWAYGTFVTPTFIPTWTQWTQWPDFATRAKPAADFVPWVFLEPPPQVWYPYDRWQDTAPRARPLADLTPWTFIPPPFQVFFPYGPWDDFAKRVKPSVADFPYQALTQVVVPPSVSFNSWLQWPELVPWRSRPVIEYPPFAFGQPPKQVWFPPYQWADFIWQKASPLNYVPLTLVPIHVPTLGYIQWPDYVYRKQPALNYNPLTIAFPITTPWNEWTKWPDWVPVKSRPGIMTALHQFSAQWPGLITLVPVTGIMSAFEIDTDTGIFAINVSGSATGPGATASAVVSIEEIGILLQGGNPP